MLKIVPSKYSLMIAGTMATKVNKIWRRQRENLSCNKCLYVNNKSFITETSLQSTRGRETRLQADGGPKRHWFLTLNRLSSPELQFPGRKKPTALVRKSRICFGSIPHFGAHTHAHAASIIPPPPEKQSCCRTFMFLSPNLLRFAADKGENSGRENCPGKHPEFRTQRTRAHGQEKVKINQKRSHNVSRSAPVPADLRLFLQPSLYGPVNIPATLGKLFFLLDEGAVLRCVSSAGWAPSRALLKLERTATTSRTAAYPCFPSRHWRVFLWGWLFAQSSTCSITSCCKMPLKSMS